MSEQENELLGEETLNEEGKTTVDEAINLIVNANSEIKAYWENSIEEEYEGTYAENRQDLIDIITVVDYIVEKYRSDDTGLLYELFDRIEQAFQNPSSDTKELIVTGILEGIQNSCNMEQLDYHKGFNPWLGPKSKRAWDGLIYLHESNDPIDVKDEKLKGFID